MRRKEKDLKRIRITVVVTIPFNWTILETEIWLLKQLRGYAPTVKMQRMAK